MADDVGSGAVATGLGRPFAALREFLRLEAAGGITLVAAAACALALANSPLAGLYQGLFAVPVEVRVGPLELAKPLLLWINDGLMAIFFLLVGMEIKREVLEGELSRPAQVALPAAAAIGGMAAPALVYAALNWGDSEALRGWAIPAATDIAFALGVLALLGDRVPLSLKVFLTAVAVLDDLGAIAVIAVFYTADLSLSALGLAAVGLVALVILNRLGVARIAAYALVGVFLWVCVLKSGVHATLAGVAVGLAVPLRVRGPAGKESSPLHHLEHALHPWVAFGVLPLFAFANAGVSFAGLDAAALLEPVPLGIAAGLFVGKQIGVVGCGALLVKSGLARLPEGAGWAAFYGTGLLCGIGFTMSLFIGSLAFHDPGLATATRLGVLAGSILSGVLGYAVLVAALPRTAARRDPAPGGGGGRG